MKGDEPMTFQAIIQRLQSSIAAHRVRTTRQLALEQIARHPEHLARDLDTSDGRPRTGITVVLVSVENNHMRFSQPIGFSTTVKGLSIQNFLNRSP
jgi:hypothetical protein